MDHFTAMFSGLPSGSALDGANAATLSPGCRRHDQLWRRTVSRRRLMQAAAGATGLVVGGTPWRHGPVRAGQGEAAMPRPIPGGIHLGDGRVIHIFRPEPGQEQSTITDFRGFVGSSEVRGEGIVTKGGVGTNATAVTGDRLVYQANLRFMQGHYLADDGEVHAGTAAFI